LASLSWRTLSQALAGWDDKRQYSNGIVVLFRLTWRESMYSIKDFEPQNLSKLIDKNQLSYDLFLAQSDVITLENNEQFIRIESTNPIPIFNGVLETTINQNDPDTLIRDILESLESRKDGFCWKVWSSTFPKNLGEILVSQGLKVSSESPGMAADLACHEFPPQSLEKLTVKQVSTEKGLEDWVITLFEGFQLSYELRPIYNKILMDAGFKNPVKSYLGLYDGQPVATASCFYSDGVVGIYWVSTIPAFRGKGIGRNMMNVILKDASNCGYRVAILQSSNKGFGMYKKLGFSQYCTNIRYEWKR